MTKSNPLQPEIYRYAFFLRGVIPGKANRRRNGINRRTGRAITFLPAYVVAALNGIQLQAQAAWAGKPSLTNVNLYLTFYVSDLRSDDDNDEKSLRDCLTKAGVIRNDSRAHIRYTVKDWELVDPGKEGVLVRLEGIPFVEKANKGRAA